MSCVGYDYNKMKIEVDKIKIKDFDVRSTIVLPDNWSKISNENKDQFARNNFNKVTYEWKRICALQKEYEKIINNDAYKKVTAVYKQYAKEPIGKNIELWLELFDDPRGYGRYAAFIYYYKYQTDRLSLGVLPEMVIDFHQRHPEYDFYGQHLKQKSEKKESEKIEKEMVKQVYQNTKEPITNSVMETFASGRYITPQEHEIVYDKNGNKHYKQRPVKYDSFDELWILIPVLVLLCFTGCGGVIFSVIALIIYIRYVEVRTQRKWENECDFVEAYRGNRKCDDK